MRRSQQWKTFWQGVIDGVQGEAGIFVPALNEFRSRLEEAAPTARSRRHFQDELTIFLHSQPFLREAQTRYLRKKVPQAIEAATVLAQRVQEVLPKRETTGNETTVDETAVDETTGNETEEAGPFIDASDAIKSAEQILPGHAAAEGKSDPRWQAIMKIGDFIEEDPDAIWPFILRWGSSADGDLRAAIATCLLEDLLEYHFNRFFPRVQEAARNHPLFAETFLVCWKLGEAEEAGNAERFEALRVECQKSRARK